MEKVMKLLHLDSSITGPNSVSRVLTSEIVAAQIALHPGIEVIYRDLASEPAMHLSPEHLAVFQGGPVRSDALGQDLALGGQYLDELFAADVLVIGAPMYNFSIPTQLKSWIDRVVVAGKTFRYTERGPEGLLPSGKKVFIASSKGGIYTGESAAKSLEHSESYLRRVLGHIGLKDITIVHAEGVGLGPGARQAAIDDAHRAINRLSAAELAARPSRQPSWPRHPSLPGDAEAPAIWLRT
jgi:FMN-dependent NADH-azoreductase